MTLPNDRDTCGGCDHFIVPAAGADQGVCYRNPPVPFPVPTQAPAIAVPGGQTAPGIAVIQLRPPISPDDIACGEFEPIPEGEPPAPA